MGGDGYNKLSTVLVIIFTISLLTLFAELFYVFWRRRQSDAIRGGGGEITQVSPPESKGLLYRLCLRKPPLGLVRDSEEACCRNSGQQSEMDVIDIDLLKIQGVFGPPRFLFTIKEEEREDLESPAEKPVCIGSGKGDAEMDGRKLRRVSLEEHLKAVAVAVETGVFGGVDDATPFSTPCASPVYFTPSASPVHEAVSGRPPLEGLVETAAFSR